MADDVQICHSAYTMSYDAVRKILEIRFQDGRVLRYAPVPRWVYHALLTSAVTAFQRHIKDRYHVRRIRY